MQTIRLTKEQRVNEIEIPEGTKQITLEVSRKKCMDILMETVDCNGKAKGKPLEKYLPQIKQKGIARLRFLMNDFSTQPIEIMISCR